MKKVAIAFVLSALSSPIFACSGATQIMAKISELKSVDNTCVAFVDESTIRHFAESGECSPDQQDIVSNGVDVSWRYSDGCKLRGDDELSGVVVRNDAGKLELEERQKN